MTLVIAAVESFKFFQMKYDEFLAFASSQLKLIKAARRAEKIKLYEKTLFDWIEK